MIRKHLISEKTDAKTVLNLINNLRTGSQGGQSENLMNFGKLIDETEADNDTSVDVPYIVGDKLSDFEFEGDLESPYD